MTNPFAVALVTGLATGLLCTPATAQQVNTLSASQVQALKWIQIEAQPSLREAQERVQAYASQLEGVNGFSTGGRWYAIALGPYTEQAAEIQLRSLVNAGLIPRDSFIAETRQFKQQFWPVGASALPQEPLAVELPEPTPDPAPADQIAALTPATPTVTTPEPEQPAAPVEETKREALQSERALDRNARKALQVALQWEGYYNSAIDGAFGPGTRNSMANWQADRAYDPTGVLTTKQREELLNSYATALASIGMAPYSDEDAGLSVAIPSAMVKFARYEAPFVHFDTINDSGVRVVMISQTGNQDTLYGLYDILQTLEVVPADGPRSRKKSSFTIEGTNSKITSYTQAELVDGTVKGFTLIWPVGDDKRRELVLKEMKASFASLGPQALADNAGLDQSTQSLDLLSGLQIRSPELSRSGFYVDANGAILTTSEAVQNCGRISINDTYDAQVVATDDTYGLALLKPKDALAPIKFASFLSVEPRLKTDVAVAGYSFEGRLNAPSLTFGTLAELRGLNGETELTRLTLAALPGDAGGPVLDTGGAVMGMLLPAQSPAGRALPEGVSFALDASAVSAFLTQNGVSTSATDEIKSIDAIDLSANAADMTVLVSCWE